MKYNQLLNNFSSGELSELLVGRVDLEEYKNGLRECENFIPQKQGGLKFREGLQFFSNVTTSTLAPVVQLYPFVSGDISYIISVIDRPTNPFVITTSQGTGCTVIDNTAGKPFSTLPYYSANWAAEWSGSGSFSNTYHYAQSGDLLVLVSPNGNLTPILIARTDVLTFTINHYLGYLPPNLSTDTKQLVLRVPYDDVNISATTLTPSATSGTNITITSSVAFFENSWTGRMIKIQQASTTGVAVIRSFTSSTVVRADVLINFGATTASTNWQLGSWYTNNYPRSVCFFEQRLVFGGNGKFPDQVWMSEQGDILQFMQQRLAQDSTTDVSGLAFFGQALVTDPFNFIIASQSGAAISFLIGKDLLYIGTAAGVFTASGGDEQSISIASIFIKNIEQILCSSVMPKLVWDGFVFVGVDGISVYFISGNARDDASELSVLYNERIKEFGEQTEVYKVDWQQQDNILWISYGPSGGLQGTRMAGLFFDRATRSSAFFKFIPGATVPSKNYSCVIQDVVCIPFLKQVRPYFNTFRQYDILTNEINIEILADPEYDILAGANIEVYLDRLQPFGVSPTVSSSFPPNTKVTAVQNGVEVGEFTADGTGQFTFTGLTVTNANPVRVGFKYSGKIKTMPFEAGQTFGQAQGIPRRVHEMIVRTLRSRGGKYQASNNNLFALLDSNDVTAPATFSGEKKLYVNASPHDVDLTIVKDDPSPMLLLWAMLRGVTYDA